MHELPKASIIIPAWNEAKVLVKTLEALEEVDYPLEICDVVVVAGGEDDTQSIAQGYRSRNFGRYLVIEQKEEHTKNAAIQSGIKESTGEVIVLLDADIIVTKNWLKELVKTLYEDKAACAASGNMFPIQGINAISSYPMMEKIKTQYIDKAPTLNGSATIAIKRSVAERFGMQNLFDATVLADDYYLLRYLLRNGCKIGFVKKAEVHTYFSSTLRDFLMVNMRWRHVWYKALRKEGRVPLDRLFISGIIISSLILVVVSPFVSAYLIVSLYLLQLGSRFIPVVLHDSKYIKFIPSYVLLKTLDHVMIFTAVAMGLSGLKRGMYNVKGPRG